MSATTVTALSAARTRSLLRARVDAALRGSTASGISVAIDIDGLGAVERRGATTFRPPASTEKLYTIFAALRRLGPAYQQITTLETRAPLVAGHLRGDVYLVAAGDPYFTTADLDDLAAQLAASGVTRIDGRLVVDDTRYDRSRRGIGWKTAWVPGESGPLSAMALNRNAWRHDSAYVADPASPVATKLRADLAAHGISVGAAAPGRGRVPAAARMVASHASAPLSDVVTRIAKDSDNFAAEMLLKEVGHAVTGIGSSASGASAVASIVRRAGAGAGTTSDGSGLSRYNRKSVTSELALLRAVERSSFAAEFRAALPVACVDGTLKRRLCGVATRGRTSAKSGTLDTARALAGWTLTADGHIVRFAFILGSFRSGLAARAAIDRAVVVLASARTG
jgi:D-alanyl-D-alanine carboxypeptidase/D-alanyl-D-alanine-endopeptidase (penicillin-binding protein 4)